MVPASGSDTPWRRAPVPSRRRCRRRAVRSPRPGRPTSSRGRLRPARAGRRTALATERRASAERAGAAARDVDEAPSVPASWTSSPPRRRSRAGPRHARPRRWPAPSWQRWRSAAGGVWWMLQDREVAGQRGHRPPAPAAPAPAPAPAPIALRPIRSRPSRRQSPPPRRPRRHRSRRRRRRSPVPRPPGATGDRRASQHRVPTTPVPPATAPGRPPSKAMLAQAATLLSEAQGLLQTGAEADGLARIAALRASFGGTRAGARRRGPRRPHASRGEALRRRRRGLDRRRPRRRRRRGDQRRPDPGRRRRRASAVRRRRRPRPPHARRDPRSLPGQRPRPARAADEDVDRGPDEAEGAGRRAERRRAGLPPHPARASRAAGGTAPVAEFALWRLGQEYRDRRLYELAASTFADLGTRFPETRYDAWFSAAELFEKQLKDAAPRPRGLRQGAGRLAALRSRAEEAGERVAAPRVRGVFACYDPRFSSRRRARTSSRIGVPSKPNDSRSRLAR